MATLNDLDGVIFDYGGVLVSHQTEADIARLTELTGLDAVTFVERYWARRADYDRDAFTAADYWQDVVNSPAPLPDEHVVALSTADTDSWMHYETAMWEWIEQLRASGKRVAMLSNMPRDLGMRLRSTDVTRLEFFDHVTLSYELGVAKPDARIYQHCLSGIGTRPERTLFLDDRIENVAAARKLGIEAIEFTAGRGPGL